MVQKSEIPWSIYVLLSCLGSKKVFALSSLSYKTELHNHNQRPTR